MIAIDVTDPLAKELNGIITVTVLYDYSFEKKLQDRMHICRRLMRLFCHC
jgi:hypothetical protein